MAKLILEKSVGIIKTQNFTRMKNHTHKLLVLFLLVYAPGIGWAQQSSDSTAVNERKKMDLDSLINAPVYGPEQEVEAPPIIDNEMLETTDKTEEVQPISEPNVVVSETFDDEYGTVRVYSSSTSYSKKEKNKDKGRDDIKTIAGGSQHSGGFGALTFKSTSFRDEAMVLAGLRGGWIINRSIAIGFEGHGIIPTAKFDDIDNPLGSKVVVYGGYGGFFLEPIVFSNQVVHLVFPVAAGAGWLGYEEDWENNFGSPGFNSINGLIDEDVFWYIEPGAALEVNIARNFRIDLGASKRFTQDLELVQTSESAFDKWNFFVTLKIGSF